MTLLYLFIGILVGMGLSAQTGINGRLRRSLCSPFLTSFVSFVISTIFILIWVLIQTRLSWVSMDLFDEQPFWIWFGGLFGCIFLTGNILLFPKLGAVQTVIFPVIGQIIAGSLIDEFGWFGAPVLPIEWNKIVGLGLVLVGVIGVVYYSHYKHGADSADVRKIDGLSIWFWRILGIFTGASSTMQITINGQLGLVLKSSVNAALVSFIVGTLSLFLMVCVQHPKFKLDTPDKGKNPWWMWIGGILGAFYVIGNAWISPQVGTGTAVVVGLFGLMSAGLIIDQTGAFQALKKPVCWQQIVSLASIFGGVCVIRLLASE